MTTMFWWDSVRVRHRVQRRVCTENRNFFLSLLCMSETQFYHNIEIYNNTQNRDFKMIQTKIVKKKHVFI